MTRDRFVRLLPLAAITAVEALRTGSAMAADGAETVRPPEKTEEVPGAKESPLAACIEPAVMRTDAAQLLPGSRKTVMVPARLEDGLGLARLSKEEFAATGLTWQQFLTRAAATAAAHLKTLKPDIRRDKKGVAQYAVLKSESHLTASVILCPEFLELFREVFGDRLVVLVPDRFTVYVFPRGFSDFQTMGPLVLEEFEKSTWPCSQEAFEVTREGVKCLGAFDTGEPEEAEVKKEKPAGDARPSRAIPMRNKGSADKTPAARPAKS